MPARFKSDLAYDPETGIFTRLDIGTPGNQRFVGKQAGYLTRKGYRRINVHGKSYSAHLLAWFFVYGVWPDFQIDHKNGNKDDNRLVNLRQATGAQNQHNRSKLRTNTSGFKGVSRATGKRSRPWQAKIRCEGRQIFLGYFETAQQASEAYIHAAKEHHKAFAKW